ncbi:hypothetical protein D5086_003532 [Populus alba]|uniref:Uncharacterized protein n=1 Tax=Populus alba TaxID=43335 RepID=A0ACC4D4J2_POPAL
MAISDRHKTNGDHSMKLFRLCPFWQAATNSSSSSSTLNLNNSHNGGSNSSRSAAVNSSGLKSTTVSSVARSLLPTRRRLRLDPSNNLYFPYEPGKQVKSAVRLKNTSKSHVAFKFQTTAPKSCYMRPPGGILAPGESLIATVFKFVDPPENNEKQLDQKSKAKFKIVSLKVKGGLEYVPELFDEQKDQVTVERVLRVVFLDAKRPSPAMEKLKRQLAEAEAALEVRKKPPPDTGPSVVGEGLVIDEWPLDLRARGGGVELAVRRTRRRRFYYHAHICLMDGMEIILSRRGNNFGQTFRPRDGQDRHYSTCLTYHCHFHLMPTPFLLSEEGGYVLHVFHGFLDLPDSSIMDASRLRLSINLGAAFGLKDHMIIPKSPALLEKWSSAAGSSVMQVKPVSSSFDPRRESGKTCNEKYQAAEKSMRMIFYLSCWGPN